MRPSATPWTLRSGRAPNPASRPGTHLGARDCLSGKPIDDLMAGARVDVNEAKRNALDFALWKGAKPGEPSWDSPWGKGLSLRQAHRRPHGGSPGRCK